MRGIGDRRHVGVILLSTHSDHSYKKNRLCSRSFLAYITVPYNSSRALHHFISLKNTLKRALYKSNPFSNSIISRRCLASLLPLPQASSTSSSSSRSLDRPRTQSRSSASPTAPETSKSPTTLAQTLPKRRGISQSTSKASVPSGRPP